MPFAPGIRNLSRLVIDTSKDWAGKRIPNLGAPTTAGDALRKGTRLSMAELPDGTDGYLLTAKGPGNSPIYAAGPVQPIATGSYTGNGTTGRTITVGFTPFAVIILNMSQWVNTVAFVISAWQDIMNAYQYTVGVTCMQVTTQTRITTNGFIVAYGVADYMNYSGVGYKWIAFR